MNNTVLVLSFEVTTSSWICKFCGLCFIKYACESI